MHARLGHEKELAAVLKDIGGRPIGGPATERLQGAREGLWTFRHDPGRGFLCGPQALKNILLALKASDKQVKIADDARSGPHGYSLDQLAALADKAGLKYKLVFRKPGQPVPVPSIINWNVHHYAALTNAADGATRFNMLDPTFGDASGVVTQSRSTRSQRLVPRAR